MVASQELTQEREKELIEKISNYIVDNHMETPAILFLESMKPLAYIGGQMAILYLTPFLDILDKWSEEGIALFQKRENIELILKKIEEIVKTTEETDKSPSGKIVHLKVNEWPFWSKATARGAISCRVAPGPIKLLILPAKTI